MCCEFCTRGRDPNSGKKSILINRIKQSKNSILDDFLSRKEGVTLGGKEIKEAILVIIKSIRDITAVFKPFSTDISRRGFPAEVEREGIISSWVTELNGLGTKFSGTIDWLNPELQMVLDLNNFTALREEDM